MTQSLDFLRHVFEDERQRVVPLQPDARPPLLVASDAQAEPGQEPTGAVLVWDPLTDARSGRVTTFSPSLLAAWGYGPRQLAEGGNPIMLCEAAMVPLFLREYAELVRGRRILYFLDNAAALHGFVKGGSRNAPLGRSILIANLLAASSGAQPWFEFVDSEANWSDGASRQLFLDKFSQEHGFDLTRARVPAHWWVCSTAELHEQAGVMGTLGP